MPNPGLSLVNDAPPAIQRTVVDGYISTVKPAPTKRTEGAWVIVPEHSTTVPFGPCQWNSGNGKAFPKQGAYCQVAFGEQEIPRIVWWEGAYEERVTAVKKPLVITGTELELEKPEAWKLLSTLGFKNGWVDLEAGNKGEYRKDLFATVELRGALKAGTPAKEAFTLPAGYLPKSEQEFIVAAGANTGLVRIFTTGKVELFSLAGNAEVSIYLDQVRFSTE